MPSSCAVVDCCDKYSQSEGRSYHKFPLKRKEILRLWIEFTQRTSDWEPNKWSSICSRHFLEQDFNFIKERRTLKKTAVPSIRDADDGAKNGKQKEAQHKLIPKKKNSSQSDSQCMPDERKMPQNEKKQQEEEHEEKWLQLQNSPNKTKFKKQGLGQRIENSLAVRVGNCQANQEHDQATYTQIQEQKQNADMLSTCCSSSSNKLCRLCAVRSNHTITFMKNFDIYGKVQKCLPTLNIQLNDTLTKEVCQHCLLQLEQFAHFVDSVLEAQRHLLAKNRQEKNTRATLAECRSFKIKQEPCVNVKQEIAECMDGYFPDDLDMGLDESCEQEGQEVHDAQDAQDAEDSEDRKLAFCDFTLPNAQEIINNCDIMEIINLDDPFIDIPDDDTVMTDKDSTALSAHGALQAYLLADEHNYATPPFLLPKEEHQMQVKQKNDNEKTETESSNVNATATTNSNEKNVVITPPNETLATIPDVQPTSSESSTRSSKPIVTSVSEIVHPQHQNQFPDNSTENNFVGQSTENINKDACRLQKETPISKPNIVVLNESIVKSTEAFRIQECSICQLKFFSIDSLHAHVNNVHANGQRNEELTPNQPMVSLPSINLQESNDISLQTMHNLQGKEQRSFDNLPNYYQDYVSVSKQSPQAQLQMKLHSSVRRPQSLLSVSAYGGGSVNSSILLNSPWPNATMPLLQTSFNGGTAVAMPSAQLNSYQAQQQSQHNACQLALPCTSSAPTTSATGLAAGPAIYESNINWQPAATLQNFHFKQEQDAVQLSSSAYFASDSLRRQTSNANPQISLRYKYLKQRYQRLLEHCELLEQCANRSKMWPQKRPLATVQQPRRLRCLLCPGHKFVSAYALLRHKHLHHRHAGGGVRGKSLYFYAKCSGCAKCFSSKLALKNHMRYICQNLPLRCLRQQMQSYKCRVCRRSSYSHWRLLRYHEQRCRNKYRGAQRSKRKQKQQISRKCPKCPRMLSSQDETQAHAMLHEMFGRQEASWNLQCYRCSRRFNHADALLRHHMPSGVQTPSCPMVATNKRELWAKCNHCLKMLLLVDELEAHRGCYARIERAKGIAIAKGHLPLKEHLQPTPQNRRPACQVKPRRKLNERPNSDSQFICLICQKRFAAARYLRQHQLTHMEQSTHICNMCQRSFKTRSGLWQHNRGFHMQLKPYVCEICDHAYTLKGDMQRCRHFDLTKGTRTRPFSDSNSIL